MNSSIDWLYNLTRFGIKPGLDVIRELLEKLKNPQNTFKSVQIAGTNGKGSVAVFMATALQEAGYKVGLYTSPHMITFNERVKINGGNIPDNELINYIEKIKQTYNEAHLQPTFFEFTTALAFQYFADENVDIAIVETGFGGRLDATSILHPILGVITNIGLDHTKYLGDTYEQIAWDKCGIIKECMTVITGERKVLDVIKEECTKKNATLITSKEMSPFKLSMLGEHQQENARVAYTALKQLNIPEENILSGLQKTTWPGRLQYVTSNILVDGAHNVAGITALVEYVRKLENREVLILGVAEDKPIAEFVELLVPLFQHIIITEGNYKPAKTSIIEAEVRKYTQNIQECPNIKDALEKAQQLTNNIILVTGSLYLVGNVLEEFQQERCDKIQN
jgi:dihydrofolate synthase / folylpolyglutamate synthase